MKRNLDREPSMPRNPLFVVLCLVACLLSACADETIPEPDQRTVRASISASRALGTAAIDSAVTDLDLDGVEDDISFLILDKGTGELELTVRFGADGALRTLQFDGFPGANSVSVTTGVFTNVLEPEAIVAFTNSSGRIQVQAFRIGGNRQIQPTQSFEVDSYRCLDTRGCYPTLTRDCWMNVAVRASS